jgi:hypothetical protein
MGDMPFCSSDVLLPAWPCIHHGLLLLVLLIFVQAATCVRTTLLPQKVAPMEPASALLLQPTPVAAIKPTLLQATPHPLQPAS